MAPLQHLIVFIAYFIFMQTLGNSQTCPDCFIHSRAAHYPNSEEKGTETGSCGFGTFGATINGGDVSAASDLFRNGLGCGACYQVRCINSNYCSDKGVTVVITDQGSGDRTDFILSKRAFARMAQTIDVAASILSQGVVAIEYRRVSCTAVQLCEVAFKNLTSASSFRMHASFCQLWDVTATCDVIKYSTGDCFFDLRKMLSQPLKIQTFNNSTSMMSNFAIPIVSLRSTKRVASQPYTVKHA